MKTLSSESRLQHVEKLNPYLAHSGAFGERFEQDELSTAFVSLGGDAMKEPTPMTKPLLVVATVFLMTSIFILDLFIPAGVLIPVLYTVPLLIALRSPRPQFFLVMAAVSIVLTIIGFLVSPPDGILWMAIINRSLAVLVIGVTAIFYLVQWRTADQLRTLQELLPYCASCKKVRDDKGYWKQLELYLQEHTGAQFTRSLCPECAQTHAHALSS